MKKMYFRKKYHYAFILSVLLLFCVNWIYNAHYFHFPRVLYSDELEGYFKLVVDSSTSFWDKVWGDEVIRPIPRLITLLIYAVCENNYSLTNVILFFNNFIISVIVFGVSYSIQEKREGYSNLFLSLCAGVLYIASRFMQCQIFSILGIMEGLAHGLTLLFFLFLVQYVIYGQKKKYILSFILWIIILLCHERYIGLSVALITASLLADESQKIKLKHIFIVVGSFISYFVLRIILLGQNTLRGTGYSKISDTFSIPAFLKACVQQAAYIMGINAGPPQRNGIHYTDVPTGINICIVFSIIIFFFITILYMITIVKKGEYTLKYVHIKILLLGIITIACCIVTSSLSLGKNSPSMPPSVALRFIYVSYSLFLILLIYVISYLLKEYKAKITLKYFYTIIVFYLICILSFEGFYRTEIKNVLFYDQEMLAESLYDTILGSYGADALNRKIIIIRDSEYLTEDKCKIFFTPYLHNESLDIVLIDSLDEVYRYCQEGEENIIVILENYTQKTYYDISHLFKI